jgi:hypothetical protein
MPPDRLKARERAFLGHLAQAAPELIRASELAGAFAALLRERRSDVADAGAALAGWMDTARDSLLNSFVAVSSQSATGPAFLLRRLGESGQLSADME